MTRLLLLTLTLAAMLAAAPAGAQTCADSQVAIQVLGSGGPFPTGRASTGYLVWSGGRSVALIDAGGGVFQRFGAAGARLDQLEAIAISHLHPDHVADLAALLWLSDRRSAPLPIVGPTGSGPLPAIDDFLVRLTGPDGALPVLGARNAPLTPIVADAAAGAGTTVLETPTLTIAALGVPHGGIPTLAYRVTTGGVSMIFGSDQTGANAAFAEFATGGDVLVLHLALAAGEAPEALAAVHATPAVVGQLAAATNIAGLVLGHVIEPPADLPAGAAFSGTDNDTLMAAVQEVQRFYAGQISVAQDLQCIVLRP